MGKSEEIMIKDTKIHTSSCLMVLGTYDVIYDSITIKFGMKNFPELERHVIEHELEHKRIHHLNKNVFYEVLEDLSLDYKDLSYQDDMVKKQLKEYRKYLRNFRKGRNLRIIIGTLGYEIGSIGVAFMVLRKKLIDWVRK